MHEYVLDNIDSISSNAVNLTLKKSSQNKFKFEPGQYAAIGFKRKGRLSPMRCFSITSSPSDHNRLEFALKISGPYTKTISNLPIGTKVNVQGPYGDFIVDPNYDKKIVMLAAGIGITPFMSMIRRASEKKDHTLITLFYSNRNINEVPFLQELLHHQKQNPFFKLVLFISNGKAEESSHLTVINSRINSSHLDQLTDGNYNDFTYFLCGPSGFVRGLYSALVSKGTIDDKIVTEAFNHGEITRKDNENLKLHYGVYKMSGISLLVAVALISFADLHHYLPKLTASQSQVQQTSQPTSQQSTTTTTDQNSSSQNSQIVQVPSAQTYQAPVSSVS